MQIEFKNGSLGILRNLSVASPFCVSRGLQRHWGQVIISSRRTNLFLQDGWVRINKVTSVFEPTQASRVLNDCMKIRLLLDKTFIDKVVILVVKM